MRLGTFYCPPLQGRLAGAWRAALQCLGCTSLSARATSLIWQTVGCQTTCAQWQQVGVVAVSCSSFFVCLCFWLCLGGTLVCVDYPQQTDMLQSVQESFSRTAWCRRIHVCVPSCCSCTPSSLMLDQPPCCCASIPAGVPCRLCVSWSVQVTEGAQGSSDCRDSGCIGSSRFGRRAAVLPQHLAAPRWVLVVLWLLTSWLCCCRQWLLLLSGVVCTNPGAFDMSPSLQGDISVHAADAPA